jgi:ribosomal protein S18 acetylase RimI-like enzyme
MSVRIEEADPADYEAILTLFPRLASFDIPNNRNPDHLWGGDAKLLQQWASEGKENCMVHVARNDAGTIVGVAMVTLNPELLSRSPSAHLEVIAVAENAEGQGVGKDLMAAAEDGARNRGASSITLFVFANNARARRVYERAGFDEELIRCIKPFAKDALS